MSDILYPASVSRTILPSKHSFRTVVGVHDKQLSDADYNLSQDIQDLKRESLLKNMVCSGPLDYSPFQILSNVANTFSIPAFDVIFQGDPIRVAGNLSSDTTKNVVTIPAPGYWTSGSTNKEIGLYVVFLEMWYARCDPVSGTGYYINPATGLRYIYTYGGVNTTLANLIPDDTIDPFNGVPTTERVQLQWALRVQPIAATYDFTKYKFGLDPGASSSETVWGQANQSSPQNSSPYQFTNMATINGDTGLWRCGDGNPQNLLATLDGYSYAMPVAIVMQRNTGVYSIESNPYGCAGSTPGSGILASGVSGRYDGKFADVVYASDLVDTRSIVSLTGYDFDKLTRQGFVDLISNNTRISMARGVAPGGNPQAIGSTLDYQISVAPSTIPNTDLIGSFDGFMNGFRADGGTFTSTQIVTVNNKTTGVVGGRWTQGDVVSYNLPGSSKAVISSLQVQALVNGANSSPQAAVSLLQGQITIAGVGTNTVTITIAKNLIGTAFDPGTNPLYLTLSVTYPANSGMDLRQIPVSVSGGTLSDADSGKTLPVYGVSFYDIQASQPASSAMAVWAVNPQYSNVVFGTRVWISASSSVGVTTADSSGNITTTFTLPRTNLNGNLTGMYVIQAWDSVSGSYYSIASRSIQGVNTVVGIQGKVLANSTVVFSLLCTDTAQLSYNSAVKGVTAIEEVALAGTATGNSNFSMDGRISVVSVSYVSGVSNTVVLAASKATLNGVSGDDTLKLVWVADQNGNFNAVKVGSFQVSNGIATIVIPPSVNLTQQAFFFVVGILPSFNPSSTLLLAESYVPYQGEGVLVRDYEVLHTEDQALVTTNGTGKAPLPGLQDIYPYNREVPIITQLPSRSGWLDSALTNEAFASFADSNYVAKRFSNVEHTFEVPIHTNDFIQPINMDRRKLVQFSTAGSNRGFSTATPHVGFAIAPLSTRSASTASLSATTAPITLYVDNVNGSDSNSGISLSEAFQTIQAAVDSLPPVLRHSCSILINPTSTPFSIAAQQANLVTIPFGDGTVLPANYHVLANLSFSTQEGGSLTIASASSNTSPVIDCTGFNGFGDGPTSAFYINDAKVTINNLTFQGFTDQAIKGIAADIEMVNCTFVSNLLSGSFEDSSTVVVTGGSVTLAAGGTGIIASQSSLDVSAVRIGLTSGAVPNAFWVVERSSTLSLDLHTPSQETNIISSTQVVVAQLNSSVVCSSAFASTGSANIAMNSVLQRTVSVSPFLGGVVTDSSSNVSTEL